MAQRRAQAVAWEPLRWRALNLKPHGVGWRVVRRGGAGRWRAPFVRGCLPPVREVRKRERQGLTTSQLRWRTPSPSPSLASLSLSWRRRRRVSAFNGGGGGWCSSSLLLSRSLRTAHVPPQPQHFAEKPREEQLRMLRWDPAGGRRGGGNDGGLPRTDGGGEDVVRWWAQSIRLRFACSASLSQLSLLRLREH